MCHRVLGFAIVMLGCLAVPADSTAQDTAELLKRAQASFDKGQYDKALDDCNRVLQLDPLSAEAYNLRGRIQHDRGKTDAALADYNKALAINPVLAKAYSNRGLLWLQKNAYEKTMADCNRALKLDPKLAEAYTSRASVWTHSREYEKALADCNRALALDPKSADAYCERCHVWLDQGQFDKGAEDIRRGLAIEPDNWKLLNDCGVCLWMQAQEQDRKVARAEAAGDAKRANECRERSAAFKEDAVKQWIHGITARPTATDIHSNLGYACSEFSERERSRGKLALAGQYLDKAESHLTKAVELKPISPRPRNNLGRLLLKRSQQFDADVRAAEAKGNAAEAARLKDLAKTKRDAAMQEFEEAVQLDPTLLEARLNLGEVYFSLNQLDRAEFQYREILKLQSPRIKDWDTINNFSQACFGLARIALARNDSESVQNAVEHLEKALKLNPQNVPALQLLAKLRFDRGEYREGERSLWSFLSALPPAQRRTLADQFGGQFEAAGKHKEAIEAWNFMAWVFATSPDPNFIDAQAAVVVAQRVASMTKQEDPVSLDTLAAALAASGRFPEAVEAAKKAVTLANAQAKKSLADAISLRIKEYQQGKRYRCKRDGSDRP